MKRRTTQQGVALMAVAMLTAFAMGFAARRTYALANVRLLSAAMLVYEPVGLFRYPLTPEQAKYKGLRDAREMSVAKRECTEWRKLATVLVRAQACPLSALGLSLWLMVRRKDE